MRRCLGILAYPGKSFFQDCLKACPRLSTSTRLKAASRPRRNWVKLSRCENAPTRSRSQTSFGSLPALCEASTPRRLDSRQRKPKKRARRIAGLLRRPTQIVQLAVLASRPRRIVRSPLSRHLYCRRIVDRAERIRAGSEPYPIDGLRRGTISPDTSQRPVTPATSQQPQQ